MSKILRFLVLSLLVMSAVHETKGQENSSVSDNSSICKLTPMDVGILLKKIRYNVQQRKPFC